MSKQIPEHILKIIRQRLNLGENDKTHDELIAEMSPMDRLRNVTGWELGGREWADTVINWANDCGMEIDDGE